MLWAIMLARLHAMYQQSRKMLIFLMGTFLAITIACTVINTLISRSLLGEELVLSGTYHCITWGYDPSLIVKVWLIGTVWEVLALHLTAWIAVKHIRELRRRPTGTAIGDCLTVLIKYHVFYFAGFAAAASFNIGVTLSPSLRTVLAGMVQISGSLQMNRDEHGCFPLAGAHKRVSWR